MKRYLVLALSLLAFASSNAQAQKPEPVYLYLYATVSDHINPDISEDRLRHLLPMLDRLRREHPEAHVSASILFSGPMSDVIEQRNPKTHIKDFILNYKRRGLIEIGYDGTDEPTYDNRPVAEFGDGSTPAGRWLTRLNADERFGEASVIRGASVSGAIMVTTSSMGKDGATGPAKAEKKVRPEVGDWEVVTLLHRYSPNAVLFGYPQANLANLPGFKGSVLGVGNWMSPVPDSAPEVYWTDNFLRTAEWSGGARPITRLLHANEPLDDLKSAAALIDHTRIHVVHMELAAEDDYLSPEFLKTWTATAPRAASLAYAYAHPEKPTLPADARLAPAAIDAAWAREEKALRFFTQDYFTQQPGSRFVSNEELKQITPPSAGYSVSLASLRPALTDFLERWGTDTFPQQYARVDNNYLSLADLYQVMSDALAEFDRTGKLPEKVKVTRVYGPIDMPIGHGPNVGEVTVAAIARKCSEIAPHLHDETLAPMPGNAILPGLVVDGVGVNSAQFLRLMATAILNPVPGAKVKVKMSYIFPVAAEIMPKSRPMSDIGSSWTLKPAPLDIHAAGNQASR
jgi:hypothetical protein